MPIYGFWIPITFFTVHRNFSSNCASLNSELPQCLPWCFYSNFRWTFISMFSLLKMFQPEVSIMVLVKKARNRNRIFLPFSFACLRFSRKFASWATVWLPLSWRSKDLHNLISSFSAGMFYNSGSYGLLGKLCRLNFLVWHFPHHHIFNRP